MLQRRTLRTNRTPRGPLPRLRRRIERPPRTADGGRTRTLSLGHVSHVVSMQLSLFACKHFICVLPFYLEGYAPCASSRQALGLQHGESSRGRARPQTLGRHHEGTTLRARASHERREAARQDKEADQRASAGGGECPMEASQGVGRAGSREVRKSGSQEGEPEAWRREAEEVITPSGWASSGVYDSGTV